MLLGQSQRSKLAQNPIDNPARFTLIEIIRNVNEAEARSQLPTVDLL